MILDDEVIICIVLNAYNSSHVVIINVASVEEKFEMKQKERILNQHPYSIWKGKNDYKRYFKDEEFSDTPITEITEETVKVFICQSVKKKKLCKQACKTLYGDINNIIRSAMINKYITDNPMEFLRAKMFYQYCHDEKKTAEQRIVSDFDMKRLYRQFEADYEKKPFIKKNTEFQDEM